MHPSIVNLPFLCSKQQPSSALTVKFASLHVDTNSSALLRQNKKQIPSVVEDYIISATFQGIKLMLTKIVNVIVPDIVKFSLYFLRVFGYQFQTAFDSSLSHKFICKTTVQFNASNTP